MFEKNTIKVTTDKTGNAVNQIKIYTDYKVGFHNGLLSFNIQFYGRRQVTDFLWE